MNWLTNKWYKEQNDDKYDLRVENPEYEKYTIAKAADLDIADHIIWIHNCLVDAQGMCTSAEGTHMIRMGIPVHQRDGMFYPCIAAIFGMTQDALVKMYNMIPPERTEWRCVCGNYNSIGSEDPEICWKCLTPKPVHST